MIKILLSYFPTKFFLSSLFFFFLPCIYNAAAQKSPISRTSMSSSFLVVILDRLQPAQKSCVLLSEYPLEQAFLRAEGNARRQKGTFPIISQTCHMMLSRHFYKATR